MRNLRKMFVGLFLTIFVLTPARAYALPKLWQGTRTTMQTCRIGTTRKTCRITFRVRDSDRAAVVVRVHDKKAEIPPTVTYRGKTYRVRCIWDGALKGVKSLTIRGTLRDGCEDARLWRIKVWATNGNVRTWLRATGANVTK